MKKTRD